MLGLAASNIRRKSQKQVESVSLVLELVVPLFFFDFTAYDLVYWFRTSRFLLSRNVELSLRLAKVLIESTLYNCGFIASLDVYTAFIENPQEQHTKITVVLCFFFRSLSSTYLVYLCPNVFALRAF